MELKSLFAGIIFYFLHITNAYCQEFFETKRVDSISVFFKSGSALVENPQKLMDRLKAVKAIMGEVRIISYTDTVGTLAANQKLAAKRMSAIFKLVRTTKLNTFIFDSINKNELRSGRRLRDSSFRRVDILVYSVENIFKYDSPINLKINFESGKDIIVQSSMEQVEVLLLILQKDSTLRIQLNGHVCCRPSHELSVLRAERVKKYLVSKGIGASRISCVGFSNTVPVVSNSNFEEQHKNMRVEVVFRK